MEWQIGVVPSHDLRIERSFIDRIETERLILDPITPGIARAVVAGDLSTLSSGEGWPHADTADAMAMSLTPGAGPGWLIILSGIVIGDCGAYAPGASGEVEIGYGLAVPYRGQGYATEAVRALCRWLVTAAGATRLVASDVLAQNLASRRVLEKVGFTVTAEDQEHVSYAMDFGRRLDVDGQTTSQNVKASLDMD